MGTPDNSQFPAAGDYRRPIELLEDLRADHMTFMEGTSSPAIRQFLWQQAGALASVISDLKEMAEEVGDGPLNG